MIILLIPISSWAIESVLQFQKVGVAEGLPSRTVWDISQSNNGLIWFATSNGLVSYDGYQLNEFRSTGHGKSKNVIYSIKTVDDQILAATLSGLLLYHPNFNQLKKLKLKLSNGTALEDLPIYSIEKFSDSIFLLGTSNGPIAVQLQDSELIERPVFEGAQNYPGYRTTKILKDKQGKVWLTTFQGVFFYNQNQNKFTQVLIENRTNPQVRAQTIFQDNEETLYFGTKEGLYFYNASKNWLELYVPELSNKFVYAINKKNETLWVGTQNHGLYSIDTIKTIRNINYNNENPKGLSDSDIYSLFFDKTGVLWAGSFNGGVNRLQENTSNFEYFNDFSQSLRCLESPVIYSIFEQSEEVFWLGTQKGLVRVEPQKNSCTLYDKNSSSNFVGLDVLFLFQDLENTNWLHAATREGINTIDMAQGYFIELKKIRSVKSAKDYRKLSNGKEFFATNRGVYQSGADSSTFHIVHSEDKKLQKAVISKIDVLNGTLLLASWEGLLTINEKDRLVRIPWQQEVIHKNPIRASLIDSKSRYWVGIDNVGLFAFNGQGEKVLSFTDIEKLEAIYGFSSIEESRDGALWISSEKGISLVNPYSKSIINFSSVDGLSSSPYTNRASFQGATDRLYFGSRNGLTIFNPKKIEIDTKPPQNIISGFLYFNQYMDNQKFTEFFSKTKNIHDLSSIDLSYKDYVFGFEFSGLHFANPLKNQYAFKLENWDDKWNLVDARFRRANYSNLPPGNYTFKLKSSNHHGAWTERPLEIKVNIHPPWWETHWAYTFYFLFVITSLYAVISFRTKSLKIKAEILEESVSLRTQELAFEKEKVEQLLSSKNEEFANVSHELKTPLTLILGPIAQLLLKNRDKSEIQKLNVVQRNSYRLLRMVDQLLNLETFRVKSITQKSPQPISEIITMLSEAFSDLAKERGISFTIKTIDHVNFEFTPDAIEKIVVNLLSNAIKYSNKGDHVSIQAIRNDKDYHVTISDSGIGISKENIHLVFERFNRVLDENSESITGAGIGLALVKSLVESHKGSIHLESIKGKGTSITIKLPILGEVDNIASAKQANDEIIAMEIMSIQSIATHEHHSKDTNSDPSIHPVVLVIEDNPDMRDYISSILFDNYQVIVATDGMQGVELAIEKVPDFIISDVMMPNMNGYDVANTLKSNEITSHIPFILLTAKGDKVSRIRGWKENIDDYLTKPFDVEELLIRIQNLLDIRNILRKRFSENLFQTETDINTDNMNVNQSIETRNDDVRDKDTRGNCAQDDDKQLRFLNQLNRVIETEYQNSDFRMNLVASKVAISERQLHRKLKGILDITPTEYLRQFRLNKACQLIKQGKPASFIWLEVGFSSHSYFTRCFKAQYGKPPSEYV